VEKIEDDFRLRAMVSDTIDIRFPHIHRNGLNSVFPAIDKDFEERIERCFTAALTHPDNSSAEIICCDSHILVPLVKSYLVYHQHLQVIEIVTSKGLLKERFVDVFDRLGV
jgi:hypothetical protein